MPRRRTLTWEDIERAQECSLTQRDRDEAAARQPHPLAVRGTYRAVPPPLDCWLCPHLAACHGSTHPRDPVTGRCGPPGPFALPECEAALGSPRGQLRRWLLPLLAESPGSTVAELCAALDPARLGLRNPPPEANVRASLSNMQRAGLVAVVGERPARYTLTPAGAAAAAAQNAPGAD